MSASLAPARSIRVALVDDHAVFAGSLAEVLGRRPGWGPVETAATLPAARELIERGRPDLVLLDARLAQEDGLELLQAVPDIAPECRVVVLSGHLHPHLERRAHELGAWASLGKGVPLPELMDALDRVLRGERVAPEPSAPAIVLSEREHAVLRLLVQGEDVASVARRLGLSPHTVRDHVKTLRGKLGVQTQLAAVMSAVRLGLVDLPDA